MILSEPVGIPMLRAASVLKRLALLPRSLKLKFAQSGPIPPSGMRLAYIGDGESFSYIRDTFAKGRLELLPDTIPITRIAEMIRKLPQSGTWLCVEIDRLLLPFLPGKGNLTFPWLRQRIHLDSVEYRRRRRKIEDNFGRKVRRYQYQFRLVHDAESLAHFYECLYLPHVSARFGSECHARTLEELRKAVAKGFLLQVLRNNRWIAGVVCSVRRDEVSARAFGHLPEEEYSLRLGALSAAYYGLLEYAQEHSFASVDLLRSRPDSRDGVYCHKQRWGAVAMKDCWPHTAIRFYPPEGMPVPESFAGLLVWDGQAFREMRKTGNP